MLQPLTLFIDPDFISTLDLQILLVHDERWKHKNLKSTLLDEDTLVTSTLFHLFTILAIDIIENI